MRRLRWAALGAVAGVTLGLLGGDAAAFVPKIEKITQQVAAANRRAERDHALVLSVALRDRDDRKLAQGELLSDPRGLARLELSDGGTLERHVLRGGNHMAARGGELLSGPSPYLPPLFLLQAGNGARVLSGLLSLGGSGEETVLGRHDGEVCYVLGGRDLAPPANESAAAFGSAGPKAAVWVTRDDWRIVRIDGADGTRWVFGPERALGETTLPEWVRIERPGVPTVRLDILGARRGRFDPATTFGSDWLLAR